MRTGSAALVSPSPLPPVARARLRWEVGIVLALSLGRSAVYSVLSLVRAALEPGGLSAQSTGLNSSLDESPAWDAVYRVLDVAFDLGVVALVVYLLWEPGRNALRRVGLDLASPRRDLGRAVLLLAVIGIPGLALYVGGRLLGVTVEVQASPLDAAWWTVPLLLLSAVRAGLVEEVILNGYLADRLSRLGVGPWAAILSTAVLRGLYHAYQGVGPLVGNVAMGIVFGWCYRRWGRVMPLVVAHALIDAIAFVGYPLAAPFLP